MRVTDRHMALAVTLLKKIKGSDVLDFDCTRIFSEQDYQRQIIFCS